jgi:hypothetical protein
MTTAMYISGHRSFEDASSAESSPSSWQSSSSVPRHHYRGSQSFNRAQGMASSPGAWDEVVTWNSGFEAPSRSSSIASTTKLHPLHRLLSEEKHILTHANTPRPSDHEVVHRRTRSNSVSLTRPRLDSFSGSAQCPGSWYTPTASQPSRPAFKGRAMSTSVVGSSIRSTQSPVNRTRHQAKPEWAIDDSD